MVKEKNKANFCSYFVFADAGTSGAPPAAPEQARRALEDLFKK